MGAQEFLLLDTASLYFRAFYALPDSIRDDTGRPVNAVRGLADFIATLADAYRPRYLIACWDTDWRPAWRVARVPSYKTHRLDASETEPPCDPEPGQRRIERVTGWTDDPETPDALEQQIPRILDLLRLAGIPVLGAPEHEADDVIGTLAAHAPVPGRVATGDRDLFQVIDDERGVQVLYLTRGVATHAVLDAAALEAKTGVRPDQYADFATLRGDASDGLPGVRGIGEKTAAALLRRFGDLDGVLAAAASATTPGLTPRQRSLLRAGADDARRAAPVVRVVTGLELPFSWSELALGPGAGAAAWDAFATAVNLGGAGERLRTALAPLRSARPDA